MLGTPIRCSSASSAAIPQSLLRLWPKRLPPSLSTRPGNLYEIISRTASNGVGKKVHQIRWGEKHIENSYWVVTRSKLKCEGRHGKAWGRLYWKGQSCFLSETVMYEPKNSRQARERQRRTDTRCIKVYVVGGSLIGRKHTQQQCTASIFDFDGKWLLTHGTLDSHHSLLPARRQWLRFCRRQKERNNCIINLAYCHVAIDSILNLLTPSLQVYRGYILWNGMPSNNISQLIYINCLDDLALCSVSYITRN